MSNILKLMLFLAGFVIVLFLLSLFFPSEYRVARSIEIKMERNYVYEYMNNIQTWSEWTIWNKKNDTSLVYSYIDIKNGFGAKQSWTSLGGDGGQEYIDCIPDSLIKYELFFDNGEFQSNGKYLFASTGNGTRLTWENSDDLGYDPFSKIFAYFFIDGYMSPDMEAGLKRLKTILEAKSKDSNE
jgi:polyketide cyclase/dehydrase/lipid transport protein